jgi:dienelactone hydrolase
MALFLKEQAEKWKLEETGTEHIPGFCEYGKRAVFYPGVGDRLNFAWIGLPEGASAENPVPGVVLVHGGGGTAFASWVDIWNKRGYAAIAMDTCGAMPDTRNQYNNWPRHSFSGPQGWGAVAQGGEQFRLPPEEQWFTHACAAVIKGFNVLAAMPEVDADNIGMTGISWGGVLTTIVSGLDERVKAFIHVYGCAYRYKTDSMKTQMDDMRLTDEQRQWWEEQWDPKNFLPYSTAPQMWFNGTNDFFFFPSHWRDSIMLSPARHHDLCMKLRWPHGHGLAGEGADEYPAFFDEHLRNGKPRIRFVSSQRRGNIISGELNSADFSAANVLFTVDAESPWEQKQWHSVAAQADGKRIEAALPQGTSAAFLSVTSMDYLYSTSLPEIIQF